MPLIILLLVLFELIMNKIRVAMKKMVKDLQITFPSRWIIRPTDLETTEKRNIYSA